MKKGIILFTALISATVSANDQVSRDQYSGLHVELLKTGYTAKSDLENGVTSNTLYGWGIQAGYELNGYHDFVASISRQDGDLNHGTEGNLKVVGNAYKLAWNSGYTFELLPGVLSLKPYGILGWTWLDSSEKGGDEAFSKKENSYTYGLGLKANLLEDYIIGADWTRNEFYGSDMDTLSLMVGIKF